MTASPVFAILARCTTEHKTLGHFVVSLQRASQCTSGAVSFRWSLHSLEVPTVCFGKKKTIPSKVCGVVSELARFPRGAPPSSN